MQALKNWCCWGTDYCKCGCLGLTRNQNVKFAYVILIFLAYIITTFVSLYLMNVQNNLKRLQCFDQQSLNQKKQCIWQQTLFRVSLAFSIMHLILFFLMLLRNELSKIMNEGAWFSKFIFLASFSLVFCYIVPSSLLHWVHSISAYLSVIWFFIQALILVDVFYSIDGVLLGQAQQHDKIHIIKAIFSFFLVGFAIFLNVKTYMSIDHNQSKGIPIVNSIVIILGFIVVFLRSFKGNTLMVFGFIITYTNCLGLWIASSQITVLQTIVRVFLVFFSLFSILSQGSNKIRTKKSSINQILALNTSKQQEDLRYVSSNKWIIFHYIFFIITFVLPTILIYGSYQFSSEGQDNQQYQDLFQVYEVVNLIAVYLIYLWSLIASKMYPDQDFSQLQSYFKEFQLN